MCCTSFCGNRKRRSSELVPTKLTGSAMSLMRAVTHEWGMSLRFTQLYTSTTLPCSATTHETTTQVLLHPAVGETTQLCGVRPSDATAQYCSCREQQALTTHIIQYSKQARATLVNVLLIELRCMVTQALMAEGNRNGQQKLQVL